MSSLFRAIRDDLESGFPEFIPGRRAMRVRHGVRTANTNSVGFLLTVFLLFLILNSYQLSPNLLLFLVLGVFLMATSLRMYATCQHLQSQAEVQAHPSAQAQAHAEAASDLLGHTELRLHVPPSVAFAPRGRLQGLRLQLALLDREFDELDYESLRALDYDTSPRAPAMSEEDINTLPVHSYKLPSHNTSVAVPQSKVSPLQEASSSTSMTERIQPSSKSDGSTKSPEDELTCSICLEQINVGELIRSLPCLHQFHTDCIDQWLRQQGICPICKFRAASRWQESDERVTGVSNMV